VESVPPRGCNAARQGLNKLASLTATSRQAICQHGIFTTAGQAIHVILCQISAFYGGLNRMQSIISLLITKRIMSYQNVSYIDRHR
jgi:hypothetical protein